MMNCREMLCQSCCLCLALMVSLSGCSGATGGRKSSRWDNIDYQRAARSPRYSDNDSMYSLPTVVTCGADDDVVCQ